MVTKSNPDTIALKVANDSLGRLSDGQANGTITPGDLIERDSVNTNRAEDVYELTRTNEDSYTAPLVALEYSKTGRGIDDDYSDGDSVEYAVANPGDRFYMFVAPGDELSTSANANVSVGDTLGPAGSAGTDSEGALRTGVTTGNEMFEALEAVDNQAGTTAARIQVEAI